MSTKPKSPRKNPGGAPAGGEGEARAQGAEAAYRDTLAWALSTLSEYWYPSRLSARHSGREKAHPSLLRAGRRFVLPAKAEALMKQTTAELARRRQELEAAGVDTSAAQRTLARFPELWARYATAKARQRRTVTRQLAGDIKQDAATLRSTARLIRWHVEAGPSPLPKGEALGIGPVAPPVPAAVHAPTAGQTPQWKTTGLPPSLYDLATALEKHGGEAEAYALQQDLGREPSRLRSDFPCWKEWFETWIEKPRRGVYRLRSVPKE